uniref:Fe-S-cluster-containing dehydrogenase component n=1 Tax=Candidatus Kentrum sp. TUN TaxID=2126343 RepID=A0A450ZH80_9GAMM|nr:MAG: Fe-S-cluster-containing dehydrogenase component [Candidatus Kentron sp. TUN]VFK52588.1 MAG: Fe-S-cluster-containing dehydrogenase component [Candidatus Kentron sp. TUN]VFK53088.1 MAG: Fe-S-cluster-containing dehydrogenase component [Candidatus Kentron sp. TUN]
MTRYAMVIDLNTCVGCNACMAACSIENQAPIWKGAWRTWVHDKEFGSGDDVIRRFFPRLCNHCSNPPCVTVCPTGATYAIDNGIIMLDEAACMGCGACALACPYKARYSITYDDIDKGREFYGSDFKRKHPCVDKCDFCAHRVAKGEKPACVETCVGTARMFGDLDDPDDPITKLVATGRAKPLMPYLGTNPNVYYIEDSKRKG